MSLRMIQSPRIYSLHKPDFICILEKATQLLALEVWALHI